MVILNSDRLYRLIGSNATLTVQREAASGLRGGPDSGGWDSKEKLSFIMLLV